METTFASQHPRRVHSADQALGGPRWAPLRLPVGRVGQDRHLPEGQRRPVVLLQLWSTPQPRGRVSRKRADSDSAGWGMAPRCAHPMSSPLPLRWPLDPRRAWAHGEGGRALGVRAPTLLASSSTGGLRPPLPHLRKRVKRFPVPGDGNAVLSGQPSTWHSKAIMNGSCSHRGRLTASAHALGGETVPTRSPFGFLEFYIP